MSQLIPGSPVAITSGRHRGRGGVICQTDAGPMWPDPNGLTRIALAADTDAPILNAYFLTTQFSLLR